MRLRRLAPLALLVAAAPLAAQGGLKKMTPWVDVAGGIWYHREPLRVDETALERTGTAGVIRVGRRANPTATSHYVLSFQYGRTPDATAIENSTARLRYTQWSVTAGIENDSDFGPFRLGLGVELGWGSFREEVASGGPVPSATRLNTSSNLVILPTVTLRDRFEGPVGVVVQARFPQLVQGIGGGSSPFRPYYVVGLSLGR